MEVSESSKLSEKSPGTTKMFQDEGDLPSPVIRATDEYYKSIFDKYDTNKDGHIELNELREMLKSDDEVPRRILQRVFSMSDENKDGKINYEEFKGMIQNRKFKELFGHYVDIYIRYILPPQHRHRVLTTDGSKSFDETEGVYEEHYSCFPPPVAMIIISIFEFACYLTDELTETNSTQMGRGNHSQNTDLQSSQTRRMLEVSNIHVCPHWVIMRFTTYIHQTGIKSKTVSNNSKYTHLIVNLTVQLLLGIFLEMVHKWWRVLLVYFLGVIAGSLATSITDPTVYLAGASGGVYAIITAHIASIIMNWRQMSSPAIQLIIFFVITAVDIGTSIYNRYWLDIHDHIGYSAHFAGAISGLLVGIWVLKNFVPTKKETYIWWVALILYFILIGTMVILNIFWTDHFLK
ncbi:hypothetical protein NQ318_002322 [Aromia moschata]|uniref:EF-hand domain-containing protein n=1 Tax=Aromia moschata TaxID=1265417 RepID=A0AAV8Z5L9_9CUCU|nr:hypothetical protein NQ318_002322 [Aromia moschata]